MPHFFISSTQIERDLIMVSDVETLHHLMLSFRVKIGEKLLFIDENKIQYRAEVSSVSKKALEARVLESFPSNRFLKTKICAAQSILKPDSQNLLIAMATQLGTAEIYPVFTDNSTVAEKAAFQRVAKWQKIAVESSKQCERADIPKVCSPQGLKSLITDFKGEIIVFVEHSARTTLKEYFKTVPPSRNTAVLAVFGPEGGFSPDEFEFFERNNLNTVSLGSLIYRAETAVAAGLSNIIYEMENG